MPRFRCKLGYWWVLCLAFAGLGGMARPLGAGLEEAKRLPWVTQRVSVNSAGDEANGPSRYAYISGDGRIILFHSAADNLVAGDTNSATDSFLHDRLSGITERISLDGNEQQANAQSEFPVASADGVLVAFHSLADNLVANDDNDEWDVFVKDRNTDVVERVSVSSGGAEGHGTSIFPDVSADGQIITFYSTAGDLVTGDTNGTWDVFVHDRQTDTTERVSVASDGAEGDDASTFPGISSDGRFVTFGSAASNLVGDDGNGFEDIFVHDRQTGETERVSVGASGEEANGTSLYPTVSGDGRFVAFSSHAENLVADDDNGQEDIFLYDQETALLTRISVNAAGEEANGASHYPFVAADGQYVAYDSSASNLVTGDTNENRDVFVYNRLTGDVQRVSVGPAGLEGNGESSDVAVSADGCYFVFHSDASNLISDDTNGLTDVFLFPRCTYIYFPGIAR